MQAIGTSGHDADLALGNADTPPVARVTERTARATGIRPRWLRAPGELHGRLSAGPRAWQIDQPAVDAALSQEGRPC